MAPRSATAETVAQAPRPSRSSDGIPVSSSPDHPDRPSRQRGLEDVRRVHAATDRSGTQNQVDLIDEKQRLRLHRRLTHHRLHPLLEFAAILRPRHQGGQGKLDHPRGASGIRNLVAFISHA